MKATREGDVAAVLRLTVDREEARLLGRTWKVDAADGSISVLMSETMARDLRAALSSALSDPLPPEAGALPAPEAVK